MTDHIEFGPWQGINADSGNWYKAIELLGTGGNAATFLVFCTSPPMKGLIFAVKVFRKLSKPERRESFLEEVKFLKSCEHPAIMRVYDEGTFYDDNPFVVTEYLPNTLVEVMRADCGFVEKVAYACQLVAALSYLDSLSTKVVHRDIKPENIFAKGGSCVLGDFGLMKLLSGEDEEDREIVKESVGVGMPRYYRTPDLVSYLKGDSGISTKSDVFQLGLVLARLFTGWNPEKSSKEFTDPVELEPVRRIPSKLGGNVVGLLNRMLEMDPDKRPSAGNLVDGWEGVFRNAVDTSHKLEDRAFHF